MMKSLFVLATAAFGTAAAGSARVLTDADFLETISGDKPVFVKFYAPWCGHCKRLAPDWDKLADEVGSDCIIGKVDATVETSTASSMKIGGYPTLKLFKDRLQYEYRGNRDVKSMAEFCEDYKNVTGKPLPMDEGMLEKIQDFAMEYLQKVSQIVAFEPSILPLCYFLGVFSGLIIMYAMQAAVAPAPKRERKKMEEAKKREETKDADKDADQKKDD